MNRKQHFIVILILGALSTIGPLSIDMYLPGFPAIARDLQTTVSHIQLSLTSYFIGISVGQLLYGPLLDRFGRKLPLYIGLGLYILTSLACAFVQSADTLIAMRFLQAIGGCASLVASRALVRDLFPVSETAKVFSMLMLVLAVSPMLAPTIGGYVTVALGWHFIFIILAVITTFILIACFYYLPEGNKADASLSLRPKYIIQNFALVFKQPKFYTFALSGSISSAVTYAYISGSPVVFMSIYKVDEKTYGWIFAFIAVAIIGSSQTNRFLLKRYTSEQLIIAALVWQTLIGILLIAGVYFNWYGLFGMMVMIFLFMCGQGITVPNASALSLAPFSKLAGSASALLGALQLGIGAIASALVSILHNGTAMPMMIVLTLCAVVSIVVYYAGNKAIARHMRKGHMVSEKELAI